MNDRAIVPGSIGHIAKTTGQSIAESFMSADVIVLIDVSGSMTTSDSRGGRRRYDVAREELARLQNDLPGKIAVVAFSDATTFVPYGVPPLMGEGTNLTGALKFVKVADGTVRFVVISDGYPDNAESALREAATFTSQIDCIYVGPENDRTGAKFLRMLAKTRGGRFMYDANVDQLATKVETLLLA